MFASILLLFFLPWLDRSPVRSGNYRPRFKQFFWILLIDIAILGYCGGAPAEEPFVMISQLATIYYIAHFLIILPIISKTEKTLPLPASISASVLHGEAEEAAPIKPKRGKSARPAPAEYGVLQLMVRLFGGLVGLGFIVVLLISLVSGAAGFINEPPAETVEHKFHLAPKDVAFSTDGPFGRFDRQQLQRGFQVYKEVCAACHGLNLVAFRNLADLGYEEPEIKAIADQWAIEVPDLNPETGEASTRKAIPSDRFPNPYANEIAARAANNNASPPDLSLITKAREHGPAYVYSLLTGYRNADSYRNKHGEALPAESRPGQGLHFNPYFPNLNIAMPPPITADGQVTYADGTNPTVDQMAKDVAAFLTWTAEPNLESRHRTGIGVLMFLLFASVLAYMAYQNIWHSGRSRAVRATGPLDPENQAKSRAAKRDEGIEG